MEQSKQKVLLEKVIMTSSIGKRGEDLIASLEIESGELYEKLNSVDLVKDENYLEFKNHLLEYFWSSIRKKRTSKFLKIVSKKLLTSDPKIDNWIAQNKNKVKTDKKKGKKIRKAKESKTRRLSHRFRNVSLSLDKFSFEDYRIKISYGGVEFYDREKGSRLFYNQLRTREEIQIEEIPVKINNQEVNVDKEIKKELFDQFALAKANYDEEQFIKNKALKEKIEEEKAAKLAEELAKKEAKREARKKVKEKKKELAKKKTKAKKQRSIQYELKESDWNKIEFYDGYFSFFGTFVNESRSKKYLNYLKPFFNRKSFSYTVVRNNNNIGKVIIPNEVYQLIEIAKQIDNIFNINAIQKYANYTFQLEKAGLEFYDLLAILGKSKTMYLKYLFEKQIDNRSIICVPEPVFRDGELIRKDASFIFLLGKESNPVVVWESVEPNKASYLFDIDSRAYPFKTVLNTIQTFLILEEPYKRSTLSKSDSDLIEGVKGIRKLKHDYHLEKDITWTRNIESQLRKKYRE
jgi:hypothetical protein